MIFYDFRNPISNQNFLRVLSIFPSFCLISEAYGLIYLSKCEVNLIPSLLMVLQSLINNFCFKVLERRIYLFKNFKDPYLVEVGIMKEPGENSQNNFEGEKTNTLQYMSARPHAYLNYDYESEDDLEEKTFQKEKKKTFQEV